MSCSIVAKLVCAKGWLSHASSWGGVATSTVDSIPVVVPIVRYFAAATYNTRLVLKVCVQCQTEVLKVRVQFITAPLPLFFRLCPFPHHRHSGSWTSLPRPFGKAPLVRQVRGTLGCLCLGMKTVETYRKTHGVRINNKTLQIQLLQDCYANSCSNL